MENRNLQPVSGMNDGKISVVLRNDLRNTLPDALRNRLRSGPLSPEQLADILDEPHTRRAWWLDLHTSADLHAGTTISDLQAAVGRANGRFEGSNNTATPNGSNGRPAASPVSFADMRKGSVCCCLRIDHAHTIDAGCFELRPFEQRRAEVREVPLRDTNPPYILTDEQRRDYLEAL
jgi:hypothetical protein